MSSESFVTTLKWIPPSCSSFFAITSREMNPPSCGCSGTTAAATAGATAAVSGGAGSAFAFFAAGSLILLGAKGPGPMDGPDAHTGGNTHWTRVTLGCGPSSAFDFFAFCLAIGVYKARQAGQRGACGGR